MFIVAYKVLGKDLVGVLIGVPILIIWIGIYIWYIKKNTMTISVLKTVHPDGKKEYEIIDRDTKDDFVIERLIASLVFCVGLFPIIAGVIF